MQPHFVRAAAELLRGCGTRVSTVIGFPHGSSTTEIKRQEIEQACGEGSVEVDAVVNIGEVLSGNWIAVQHELTKLAAEAHRHGALLKIIFETGYLTDDPMKVRLCQACEAAGVDFVKTSTGFGFAAAPDGCLVATGATEHDIRLMRSACSQRVGVKASGGVRDLATLLRMRELGATRIGTSSTAAILRELSGTPSPGESRHGY